MLIGLKYKRACIAINYVMYIFTIRLTFFGGGRESLTYPNCIPTRVDNLTG